MLEPLSSTACSVFLLDRGIRTVVGNALKIQPQQFDTRFLERLTNIQDREQ